VKIRLSERARSWVAVAALLAAILGASLRTLQPPAPLPPDAPDTRFSEGRAREVVRRLADDIGFRVNGTPSHVQAAEMLAGELRRIPGVEVELQTVSGTQVYRSSWLPAFVYRTVNVVARLPGRSPDAILLDAHFDTLVDSVGAADDAAGVAAIVEAMRVLAREAPLAHTIIVNLNGGEEAGLFGAAGFLKHRWARDVRAYLYLEALPAGRADLFGAGPGNAWLAETYARVAPAPVGNVVGQDLVESGLLPHNGDFTPFHEGGLHGLDVAMTGDGWAYHDALDRPARLQPGGLQHMGDTAVAVTRALANGPLPHEGTAAEKEPVVFYDLLGVVMVAYRARTSRALAIAALILAAIALALAGQRKAISLRSTLGALAWTVLAVVAAIGGALGAGLLLGRVLGRPHGWFSAPALLLPAFAAPALAAAFGVHALWRRRGLRSADPDRHAFAVWAGGLLFWSAWLALATVREVAAGYLALQWVWSAALGMIGALLFPRARAVLALASLVPGAAVTIELGVLFLNYFVPITGTITAPQPFDAAIAVLAGSTVAAVGVLAWVVVHRAGGFGRASLACAAVAIVGLAVTALHFPFTPQRPKRIRLAHVVDDAGGAGGERRSALLLGSGDALGVASVLPSVPGFAPARPGWPPFETWLPPLSHELPAPPPELPAPRVEVTHDAYDATTDRRELGLRVTATGAQIRLAIPSARLLGWSLGAPPEAVMQAGGRRVIHLEGLAADGAELSVSVRGRGPLPIELRAIAREPARDEAVEAVTRRLPSWTTTTAVTIRVTRLDL
jgi:hypothetical protein